MQLLGVELVCDEGCPLCDRSHAAARLVVISLDSGISDDRCSSALVQSHPQRKTLRSSMSFMAISMKLLNFIFGLHRAVGVALGGGLGVSGSTLENRSSRVEKC